MRSKIFAVGCALIVSSAASVVHALPFNDDMVGTQMIAGSVMRPKAPNSVPYGSLANRIESREAAEKLVNPIKGDIDSAKNGERLFAANCMVCHGRWVPDAESPGKIKHLPGTLLVIPSMDLRSDLYKQRTDGSIYSTIHFGIRIMPGHGWKLSPTEHWDIVNYIRKMQGQ